MSGLINYIKKAFKNYPDTTTRISAENLNHLDDGIYDLDQQLGTSLVAEDDLKFNFSKSGNKYGYKDSNGNFIPFDRVQASKTVTASTSTQTVTPDAEYSGIASVIINPQQHSSTSGSVTNNGTIDLGIYHNTRFVPVNVPVDAMIPTLNKGTVSGGGSTRVGLYLSVVPGCYYILAVSGAETGTDARVTSFSGCQIISNSGAQAGFRGCHCCLYLVLATSSAIAFPSWPDEDMDGRAAIAMKIT